MAKFDWVAWKKALVQDALERGNPEFMTLITDIWNKVKPTEPRQNGVPYFCGIIHGISEVHDQHVAVELMTFNLGPQVIQFYLDGSKLKIITPRHHPHIYDLVDPNSIDEIVTWLQLILPREISAQPKKK